MSAITYIAWDVAMARDSLEDDSPINTVEVLNFMSHLFYHYSIAVMEESENVSCSELSSDEDLSSARIFTVVDVKKSICSVSSI
ncbi:hypothetical protein TNCV_4774321 [Trichonephila clavipes]|nr:hypothetical protein TNCV_4774321 [Trichonephila clavipes]